MAFVTWRVLYNKMPTDEKIAKLGYTIQPRCYCCTPTSTTLETSAHLFWEGTYAQDIWKIFAAPFGLQVGNQQYSHILLQWWNHRYMNLVTSFMARVLPAIITWELWRSRCASKYGGEAPQSRRSEKLITANLVEVVRQKFGKLQQQLSWDQLQKLIDQPMVHRTSKLVRWVKPPPMSYKLNSDGSCQEGNSGAG
ncbi:uncharacterized protein LOC142163095 [Nicotiana tabacum]|uniref:Uncharacterized protein LOC142163095 n=1 Tax=Nicotiana tabacum TaxID=4097 RepID=A0AC58RUT9_TOBAC